LPDPVDDGVVLSKLGPEVAGDEAMEDGVGDEENQPDSYDGVGVMVEGMVGVPGGDDFIESLVFDLPPGVTEANDGGGGDLFLGQRSDPGPIVGLHGVCPSTVAILLCWPRPNPGSSLRAGRQLVEAAEATQKHHDQDCVEHSCRNLRLAA